MNIRSLLPLLTGTLLLAAGGWVHGQWTGRWESVDLSSLAGRVHQVPDEIGDWVAMGDGVVSDEERQSAELTDCLIRHYRDRRSGAVVTLTLMAGPPGPVAVHPPTACYRGRGFEQAGAERPHDVDSGGQSGHARHSFLTAQFHRPGRADSISPCITWSWTTNGNWTTPANPRLAFAGAPILFKLYVTHEARELLGDQSATPIDDFVRVLIPELQQSVFAAQPQT